MQNRVKVVICGKTYTLQTDESPSYMITLAKEVDKRINTFLEENESAALTSAAVMVALELMDESMKSVSDVDNIRAQIKGYVEEAASARIEADQLKRELNLLKRENENLKNDLELYNLRDKVGGETAKSGEDSPK